MIKIITDLPSSRWQEYRDLRIRAVTNVPYAFGTTAEEELSKSEDRWKKRLEGTGEDRKDYAVFAEEDGNLVGTMGAYRERLGKVKHSATVVGVYIDEKYRGQGISSLLMDALIKKISEDTTVIRLELMVVTTQEAAIALYKKFGFEIVGTVHKEVFFDGTYYDEYIMEKFL